MAGNVGLQELIDRYTYLLHNGDRTLADEYKALREAGSKMVANTEEYKRTVGSIAKNRAKNRYRDIIPFDATRVKLSEIPDAPCSDYINANYVKGVDDTQAYIASQAPLPHTINDFWRMIWESNVKVVLMACNETEGNKAKCARYWPEEGESNMFGNVNVSLTSVDTRDNGELLVRRLNVQCDGDTRIVMQYHYTAWPDHGIPHSMAPILDMLTSARLYQPLEEPPIVVHCSAGCGRTGTLLAIDYVRGLLNKGQITTELNILHILTVMRQQRQSLIQTPEQYEIVFRAVLEMFQQKLTTAEVHLYENLSTGERKKRTQHTKKSIKESSAIAQDMLSSLAEPEPANHSYTNVTFTPDGHLSVANGDVAGKSVRSSMDSEKKATSKLVSATISLEEDNQPEQKTNRRPDKPEKPALRTKPVMSSKKPTVPKKPMIKAQSLETSTTVGNSTSNGTQATSHSSLPVTFDGPAEVANDVHARPLARHETQWVVNSQYCGKSEGIYHLVTSGDEYSLADGLEHYHLEGDCDDVPQSGSPTGQGQSGVNSIADMEEEYSYADLAGPRSTLQRKLRQPLPSHDAENAYSLAGDMEGRGAANHSAQSEYLLADDDDGPAPPPLPVKTEDAYDNEQYSLVNFSTPQTLNVFAQPLRPTAVLGSKTAPRSPGLNVRQNLFKFKLLKNTLPNVRRSSNSSNASLQEEVMYRGMNMALPNRMERLKGEKSMPLLMKR